MRQMQSWIESTVDEEISKPTRIFLFSPDLLLDELPLGLATEIRTLGGSLVRLKTIADSLGIGESKTEEKEIQEESLAKPHGPRAKVIYNGMKKLEFNFSSFVLSRAR